ncbi:MAG TPA: alpha/beta hydrolase-fold protein, partial [Pyrinomonadaceae bacterium]
AHSQSRALNEEFRMHGNFHSEFLKKDRNVIVWLPPGYHSEPTKRYPVLYMHDGGVVFILWRIDEIAKPLITSGQIEPLIIVLVNHGGTEDDRFDEYTPTKPPNFKSGGKADSYGRMLVEELKPFIDSQYRTLTDPANTGIGGVSLGAIVSLYLGLKYPMVFGKLAVISPSVWWDNKIIVRNVKDLKTKPALRIWLDIGTGEGQRSVDATKELRNAFVKKGWVLNSDLLYFEAKGSGHNEQAFAQRAEPMLKHLFPQHTNRGSGENPRLTSLRIKPLRVTVASNSAFLPVATGKSWRKVSRSRLQTFSPVYRIARSRELIRSLAV